MNFEHELRMDFWTACGAALLQIDMEAYTSEEAGN